MNSPFAIHLQKQFASIRSRKPQYSMRSFALMLGISPASLSKVLNGKQTLTEGSIREIAKKLKIDESTTSEFVKASSFHSSDLTKKAALESARRSLGVFDIFANWYHFALLEWIRIRSGKLDVGQISQKFGLNEKMIEESIQLLQTHGFLKASDRKGELQLVEEARRFGDSAPSRAIREYHAQLIAKAGRALEEQHYSTRNISSSTISVSKESYEQIVSEIVKFRKKISKLADISSGSDQVYALNIQLIPLSLEDESVK